MMKSHTLNRDREKLIMGVMFVLPALILLFVFLILPFINAFFYSLTSYNILSETKKFIGLENYIILFQDPAFWIALRNTFYFVVIVVPFQTALALALALIVNRKIKGRAIFRIGFFSPQITSMVVISILWTILYARNGLINNFLSIFGIPAQPFLNSSGQAMNSIIFMSGWQAAGYFMMIFLAGLQNIPDQLYEAVSIDGANAWQKFRYVTLPGLRSSMNFVLLITTIQAFKLFQQPFIMTGGGPNGSTKTVVQMVYTEGFQFRNAGYSSAMAVIFFIIVFVCQLILQKILNRGE